MSDGIAMPSYEDIRQLSRSAQTPFFLCDQKQFESNFDRITQAFRSRWERFILAYSYKTNYVPHLCRIIRDKGGWAEIVSGMEYDLALRIGQDAHKVIFNGPAKRPETIIRALDSGCLINIDSARGLETVIAWAKAHPDRRVGVGLRVNMGLWDPAGASHVQGNLPISRFGFDQDSENLHHVTASLSSVPNLSVVSLHGHTSTTDRAVWCYERIASTLCSIAQEYFPQSVQYINVGGGIFGDVPPQMQLRDVPTFDDYASAISGVLRGNPWACQRQPTLVLEPGVAMVANVFSYITQVVDVKRISGRTLVTVDGTAMQAKPTLHQRPLPFRVVSSSAGGREAIYSVVGSTCMETDYLLTDIHALVPAPGDFIQIKQVGAYTVVLAPPFINYAPAILCQNGEQFTTLRVRQTLDSLLTDYRLDD
jgi:diaminopimelate decarboxylase